jgi:hypothetical protein
MGISYFQLPIPLYILFTKKTISQEEWLKLWHGDVASPPVASVLNSSSLDSCLKIFESNNVHIIAHRKLEQQAINFII